MTIRLVYHTRESLAGGISPFDDAILEISKGQDVWMACPYLNLSYLKRIVNWSHSWQLITDVEEWLSIHSHPRRLAIRDFIIQHQDKIHHVRDLHAKTIIASEKALIGSANFTKKGVTTRVEMSVLLEQEMQVEELREWFSTLWGQSTPIDMDEVQAYIDGVYLYSPMERKLTRKLTSQAIPIRSKLKPLTRHNRGKSVISCDEVTSARLIERVRVAPSRVWINKYFNLMQFLIGATGLQNNDPRLVTSIPTSSYFLPFSVNNRYVLAPRRKKTDFLVAIIYGPEFEVLPELQAKSVYYGRFDPLFRSEGINDTPFFVRFGDADVILDSKDIQEAWVKATLLEMERASSSPYRRFHQPVVYEAAVNLDYRELILDKAFSSA